MSWLFVMNLVTLPLAALGLACLVSFARFAWDKRQDIRRGREAFIRAQQALREESVASLKPPSTVEGDAFGRTPEEVLADLRLLRLKQRKAMGLDSKP